MNKEISLPSPEISWLVLQTLVHKDLATSSIKAMEQNIKNYKVCRSRRDVVLKNFDMSFESENEKLICFEIVSVVREFNISFPFCGMRNSSVDIMAKIPFKGSVVMSKSKTQASLKRYVCLNQSN